MLKAVATRKYLTVTFAQEVAAHQQEFSQLKTRGSLGVVAMIVTGDTGS